MLDNDFDQGDLSQVCFIMAKYLCKTAAHLKKYMIDSFTINAFVNLKNK